MIKHTAIQCLNCNDIIYSRAQHDFRSCKCGDCFVDGGLEYLRFGAKDFKDTKQIIIHLPVSKQELYDDWNLQTDKYGKIPIEDIDKYTVKEET